MVFCLVGGGKSHVERGAGELDEFTFLLEGISPMRLPIGPSAVDDGFAFPRLPRFIHTPVATACFVPVVTIEDSSIGTRASRAISWHRSCLRM